MTDTAETEHRRSTSFPIRWGTQTEFTDRYEEYLDTVYGTNDNDPSAGGRVQLALSIGEAIVERHAHRVLDCAVGTGFPALDLAASPPTDGFTIHCTDSDRAMLDILANRVRDHYGPQHGVSLDQLAPKINGKIDGAGVDGLLLDWAELGMVDGVYDYVMCRGNSLVYADTWAGGKQVASERRLKELLRMIAAKVKRGGYLHIDAPRNLRNRCSEYSRNTSADGETTIWEAVKAEPDCREWQLTFKSSSGSAKFKRFSTLMNIDDVSRVLKEMGFAQTDLVELEHERPGFGVIIAKKVN